MPHTHLRCAFSSILSCVAGAAVLLAAGCTSAPKAAAPKPEAPEILGFAAANTQVVAGTGTTLTAYFAGGTGTVDGGVGAVKNGQPVSVTPTKTTTYTLTVKGAGGSATAVAKVTVVAGASLTVTLLGTVPPSPGVMVAGPGGPMAIVSKTTTLTSLAPGIYQVTAAPTVEQGVAYTPAVTGSPVLLAAGGSASVGVAWRAQDTPPTLSAVTDQQVVAGTPTVVDFTVGDQENVASTLTVKVTADDTTLLPASSLTLGGTGADRTLTLTAGSATGRTTVHLSVTDGAGNTTAETFGVEVVDVLVTNGNDAGPGSLRAAAAAGGTVGFAPAVTGTLQLTGGSIAVDRNLEILGPGAKVLAIDGAGTGSIFAVSGGFTLNVSGLTLQDADGAITVAPNGVLDVSDCVFTRNHGNAAAIYDLGTATVTRSLFVDNRPACSTCSVGGTPGGAVLMAAGTSFTLSDSTLTNNRAVATTGSLVAAVALQLAGKLVIRGSTIVGNRCPTSGCAAVGAPPPPSPGGTLPPLEITGSIVAANVTVGADSDVTVPTGQVTADADNVLGTVSGFTPDASDAVGANPGLSGLANHGGPTQTMVPLAGSPALDRVPLSALGTDTVDQRGNTRRADGNGLKSDAGAVDRLPTDP